MKLKFKNQQFQADAARAVTDVFRDSSFNEAANKMNLFELFKQKCGWTDEEVKNNVRVI